MNYPYCVKFGALTEFDMRISLEFPPMIGIYQLQIFSGMILTSNT